MAEGRSTIDAFVTEVRTALPAKAVSGRADLLYLSFERVFLARVPLPAAARSRITVSDPWSYAQLGEAVEAWGFRYMQVQRRFCDRDEIARRWFTEEYVPVVRMLKDADVLGEGTEAEAYMRVASERYRLMRTHEWNDAVIARLQADSKHRRRRG
jgi:hypothetical protein